jgi:hypothetical protein
LGNACAGNRNDPSEIISSQCATVGLKITEKPLEKRYIFIL